MRFRGRGATRLRCLERTQIHSRIARLPAPKESLDRWVHDDAVQLDRIEQTVAAYRRVLRRDAVERTSGEIAGEDDVHDVLRLELRLRRDRVDDRDRALERNLVGETDLFRELAMERVDEALPRVDPASGEQPVLAARGLLVAA